MTLSGHYQYAIFAKICMFETNRTDF